MGSPMSLQATLGVSDCTSGRFMAVVAISLLVAVGTYTFLCPGEEDQKLFSLWPRKAAMTRLPNDELERTLQKVSMDQNKTLIITVLNETYAEENGLLDIFIGTMRGSGEETRHLAEHLLLVAEDQKAFDRCMSLNLHCHRLAVDDVDLSREMALRPRTRFLAQVLAHEYSFIFTDVDVLWLRNPFTNLNHSGEDLLVSCDDRKAIDTGFFFASSNSKTVAHFGEWYSAWMNASYEGAFHRLGMTVQCLDKDYFAGMCQDRYRAKKVTTVRANCCPSMKAKISDLASMFEAWRKFDGASDALFVDHTVCHDSLKPPDDLELALRAASMANKNLIISMLNKAYAEENGLLDLFLGTLRKGENTSSLIDHILLVAVDQTAFDRCKTLNLHCYLLAMGDANFSEEVLYMTDNFIDMMWRRTRFLGQVLKRQYTFIFTDMDILWLRNPLAELKHNGEDLLLSCDGYNGRPFDNRNTANTGFFFVASNDKTITLFDEWYAARNSSEGVKEQDVLNRMKSEGAFQRLSMKVRFLDTEHFAGMCQDRYDMKKVTTVHANCCRTRKAKISDLTAVLEAWKGYNGTSSIISLEHKACHDSWKTPPPEKDGLETALQGAAMANKTLIISVLNKAYAAKENGLLDLFLESLREGEGTESLIKHILLVAMDQTAFDRCKNLGGTQCYQLGIKGANFSSEQLYMSDGFIQMMWQRIRLLGDVLKHGYSFIFTDLDVMWLRNPFPKLNYNGEDLLISCDGFNGRPYDYSNQMNTGFFFVASNNKTIALFDEWYARKNSSEGMKEQDVLNQMKDQGAFRRLGMKVRILDTVYFSGFCHDSSDFRTVTTVHANCCRTIRAKIADLKAVLRVSKRFNETNLRWPQHTACRDSWRS